MGQTIEKEKLVLIPPQIRQKRRVPLFRSDFDQLGRASEELLTDFFPDDESLQVNLFLKPHLPEGAPDVNSYTNVAISAHPLEDISHSSASGGLAVEALVPETNLRASAAVRLVNSEPNLVVSVDHKPTSYFRWFAEGNPENYFGGGLAFATKSLTAGVYTRSFANRSSSGALAPADKATAWASYQAPAIMLGVRSDFQMNDQKALEPSNTDFAVAFFDPTSPNRDRPAFEVAAVARDMGRNFSLSYFQHFVIRRKIYNPLEQDHITQIVNYVDVGTKVSVNRAGGSTLGVASSWQLNKNHMIKGKVDNKRASLAWVFKNWSYPSFSLSFCGKYDYAKRAAAFGATVSIQTSVGADFENTSADYEKSVIRYQADKASPMAKFDRVEVAANPAPRASEPTLPASSQKPAPTSVNRTTRA